jgi:SAM-dependent methyltransferase
VRALELASLVDDVQHTEHRYLLHGPRHDPVVNPWMPYQPADFIGILWECMPEITICPPREPAFLDVGCGPGTKMQIASTLFGFNVTGIEVDEAMAAEARSLFPQVHTGSAQDYKGAYDRFDVIWLYRPFRDPSSEYKLEQLIMANMRPGAILAGASWETDVPALGWQPVVDDCLLSPDGTLKIVRGAWQKPPAVPE